MMERLMDVNDVANVLAVGKTVAYGIMRDIGIIKIGGIIRVSEQDFRSYINSHKQGGAMTRGMRTAGAKTKRKTLPDVTSKSSLLDSDGKIKRR